MNPLLFLFGLFSAAQITGRNDPESEDGSLANETLGFAYGHGGKDRTTSSKKEMAAGRNKTTEDSSGQGSEEATDTTTQTTVEETGGTTTASPEQHTAPTGDPNAVEPPKQSGTESSGVDADTGVDVSTSGLKVISGRVTTLDPGSDVASVRILSGPDHGNVTVNPDKSLALVLTQTDYTGALSFRYEITKTDGTVQTVETELEAVPGPVAGGWGEGNFYMLATDENGDVVVEYGDNHRDVYVSGSSDALSIEDIARLEGLSPEQITGSWLANHAEYGGTEGMALDDRAGDLLWRQLAIDSYKTPASHWLRLEAGYEYDMTKITAAGLTGESELHPIHITSYGTGEKPVILNEPTAAAEGIHNVVFSNLELGDGIRLISGDDILMHDITSTGSDIIVLNIDGFTLRNSEVYGVSHDRSLTDGLWDPNANRISGLYANKTDGLLVENTLFDHNGWVDGYDPHLSLDSPQPPSIYSHNMYISSGNLDVTIRDTISMRAASFGLQLRSGGFLEDNVFLDNNAGVYVAGAPDGEAYNGNYSLYADNVTTSGAHKEFDFRSGRITMGNGDYAPLTAHVDNIIAHLADPNNPDEIAAKTHGDPAMIGGEDAFYNDTIIYNWKAPDNMDEPDQNTEGLDTSVLDATTIQHFASQLLGKEGATIEDLALYLRENAGGYFDGKSNADIIIEFFQSGFGLTPDGRLEPDLVRFVPNDVGDGVRWDNRLNWSTEDLPGSVDGDSVDLAGNWVNYGGTTKIMDLYFGDGGRLHVGQGRLDITGEMQTDSYRSELDIDGAGQVWIDGYDDTDRLNIDVAGGRFANTGDMQGKTFLDIRDGQAILATEDARFDVHGGGRIKIVGDEGDIGFEGTDGGTAVLRFDEGGTLRFVAGSDGAFGQIAEFRSGANGDAEVNVQSGVNFGEGRLELNLSGVTGGAASYRLVDVDQMIGAFSEIDVIGLAGDRDARLVFDYEEDAMILRITEAGAGAGDLDLVVRGEDEDARSATALWDALTADHAPLPDDHMPDEVTVNGEVLALV